MKSITVPAQVTTVEDRLAGNLSLTQLLLLVCPVFVSCVIYVVFPPFIRISMIKIFISVVILILFAAMSIRFKGKIILMWLVLVLRYRNRPRYYLYNKNDRIFREHMAESSVPVGQAESKESRRPEAAPLINLATPDIARLEIAIADSRSNFNLKQTKKGVLSVHITEIQ